MRGAREPMDTSLGVINPSELFSTFSDYYLENAEQNAWLTIKEEILFKGRGTFVAHSRKNRRKKALASLSFRTLTI